MCPAMKKMSSFSECRKWMLSRDAHRQENYKLQIQITSCICERCLKISCSLHCAPPECQGLHLCRGTLKEHLTIIAPYAALTMSVSWRLTDWSNWGSLWTSCCRMIGLMELLTMVTLHSCSDANPFSKQMWGIQSRGSVLSNSLLAHPHASQGLK